MWILLLASSGLLVVRKNVTTSWYSSEFIKNKSNSKSFKTVALPNTTEWKTCVLQVIQTGNADMSNNYYAESTKSDVMLKIDLVYICKLSGSGWRHRGISKIFKIREQWRPDLKAKVGK